MSLNRLLARMRVEDFTRLSPLGHEETAEWGERKRWSGEREQRLQTIRKEKMTKEKKRGEKREGEGERGYIHCCHGGCLNCACREF